MWKCEVCKKEFNDKTTAIEVRFGYVDNEASERGNQYDAFYTDNSIAPLCDDCAIAYIRGEEIYA